MDVSSIHENTGINIQEEDSDDEPDHQVETNSIFFSGNFRLKAVGSEDEEAGGVRNPKSTVESEDCSGVSLEYFEYRTEMIDSHAEP
jgi:hypothetical protein